LKKYAYLVPVALFLCAAALPALAGGTKGCTDSPENPTAVLGLIVSAATIGFMQIRNRIGIRGKSDNKYSQAASQPRTTS
jgi:XrtJ-associated TM-motif-TM protein